ncbi:unnamed protein product [Leptidea sinapis]|uniref:Steroid 5-alpha reductase C-terminal domain-containing protein n=1 Tax=Leptidea sinapis TaxID=189913 RepID=A0A5E4QGZ2_9NEOP|nr:unnamed protein product [Leptidea sinapis]
MSTRSGRLRSSIVNENSSPTRNQKPRNRSPARNRKSSVERNAASQSPSRKSPSRKSASKYPARKSPSRTVKESDNSKEKPIPKSPAKRPALNKDISVRLEDMTAKFEIFRSTRAKRAEYSLTDIPTTILAKEDNIKGYDATDGLRNRRYMENLPQRRSSRLSSSSIGKIPEVTRSVSKSLSESISKSIDTYSDDEPEIQALKERSISVARKLSTPQPANFHEIKVNREFGGHISSFLLMFLIPLTIFAILITCSRTCKFKDIFISNEFKSIESWFGGQEFVIVLSQYLMQAIILGIPVCGIKAVDECGKRYCFNALFSCVVTLVGVFVLDFYKFVKLNHFMNYTKLGVASYLVSMLLAFLLYVKGRKISESFLNPYAKTGYVLNDFFIGREIQPQIKKFNIKLWLYRVCNISTIVLLTIMFVQSFVIIQDQDDKKYLWTNYKALLDKVQWNPTTLYFTLMQMCYILYFVVYEHTVVSTFYWQSEGLGYLQLVASALYPFYFTSISKYVIESQLVLKNSVLWMACAAFTLGLLIMVTSNNIKYEFRNNPLQASLAHVDFMPTFHGKKLIISNMWGIVRHPNYAGDILIHIALALPGILSSQIVAASPALITILVLLHRCWRDHVRCGRRYGAAWKRYCKRVPSALIPKIL